MGKPSEAIERWSLASANDIKSEIVASDMMSCNCRRRKMAMRKSSKIIGSELNCGWEENKKEDRNVPLHLGTSKA